MRKRSTTDTNPATADGGNGRSGCEIRPTAVYTRRQVADMLQLSFTQLARLRRHKGFPIQSRGAGFVTGQELLDWIKGQNAAAN